MTGVVLTRSVGIGCTDDDIHDYMNFNPSTCDVRDVPKSQQSRKNCWRAFLWPVVNSWLLKKTLTGWSMTVLITVFHYEKVIVFHTSTVLRTPISLRGSLIERISACG